MTRIKTGIPEKVKAKLDKFPTVSFVSTYIVTKETNCPIT